MTSAKFYDVKTKSSVTTEVTGKRQIEGARGTRYMVYGNSEDGRRLSVFVNKTVFESLAGIPEVSK